METYELEDQYLGSFSRPHLLWICNGLVQDKQQVEVDDIVEDDDLDFDDMDLSLEGELILDRQVLLELHQNALDDA